MASSIRRPSTELPYIAVSSECSVIELKIIPDLGIVVPPTPLLCVAERRRAQAEGGRGRFQVSMNPILFVSELQDIRYGTWVVSE